MKIVAKWARLPNLHLQFVVDIQDCLDRIANRDVVLVIQSVGYITSSPNARLGRFVGFSHPLRCGHSR